MFAAWTVMQQLNFARTVEEDAVQPHLWNGPQRIFKRAKQSNDTKFKDALRAGVRLKKMPAGGGTLRSSALPFTPPAVF